MSAFKGEIDNKSSLVWMIFWTNDGLIYWRIFASFGLEELTNLCLTHWGWVTHICVSNITTIGSDNGLSPSRRHAIIRTNAGILLIEPLGTNFNEILIEMHIFSLKKIHFKMSSGKRRPFCLGLNVLTQWHLMVHIYGSLNRVIIGSGLFSSKKTSKLRVTSLCEGNPQVTGRFPKQRASNAEKYFHLMTS